MRKPLKEEVTCLWPYSCLMTKLTGVAVHAPVTRPQWEHKGSMFPLIDFPGQLFKKQGSMSSPAFLLLLFMVLSVLTIVYNQVTTTIEI